MKFWIQKNDDKPIGLPIRNLNQAQLMAKKNQIVIKGVAYKVIGIYDELNLDEFWTKTESRSGKEANTSAYDRLKANIEQFRKTKIWPDKN